MTHTNLPTEKTIRQQQINEEIEEQEEQAREYKQWLTENPNASYEDKCMIRRRLFNALQKINDLVCKLKPSEPYTIR